ncbi:MAG: Smr/MutS family protein [Alphaproteobacteria bacterium]|nr:Smr/MutS family protein [Alphaproteobacteria bacterium]
MAKRLKPGDDDDALWKAVTKDVKPIKRAAPLAAAPEPDKKSRQTRPKKTQPAISRPAVAPARLPKTTLPPRELSHGQAAGLDKRTMDRLRRGQLPVEAEIDLHGHTQEEAHGVLNAFIIGHAAAGRRCVRVITGKGSFREGGGVLKAAVPRWLNESPLQDRILAFTHARRDDGGEGALYVLLRRQRFPGGGR